MADETTAEQIAMALGVALLRKGILDASDMSRAADEEEANRRPESAHALRVMAIEESATMASDWDASRRRAAMHVVKADKPQG